MACRCGFGASVIFIVFSFILSLLIQYHGQMVKGTDRVCYDELGIVTLVRETSLERKRNWQFYNHGNFNMSNEANYSSRRKLTPAQCRGKLDQRVNRKCLDEFGFVLLAGIISGEETGEYLFHDRGIRGGGVGAYIRESSKYKCREDIEELQPDFEHLWL